MLNVAQRPVVVDASHKYLSNVNLRFLIFRLFLAEIAVAGYDVQLLLEWGFVAKISTNSVSICSSVQAYGLWYSGMTNGFDLTVESNSSTFCLFTLIDVAIAFFILQLYL